MSTFLTAQWRKLILANYVVDPVLLQPYLPAGTVLDQWNGACYVSLVGFLFADTRVKGIAVPYHRTFEEVNLRFYVRVQNRDGTWTRGVVFIKEIVPRRVLAIIANVVYGEPYVALPMSHIWDGSAHKLSVVYRWKLKRWHELGVTATQTTSGLEAGSEAAFITEHYYGYTRRSATRTTAYEVQHPPWVIYTVSDYAIDVDFKITYGDRFGFLGGEKPRSVFLAEGSAITVKGGFGLQVATA